MRNSEGGREGDREIRREGSEVRVGEGGRGGEKEGGKRRMGGWE